jgi:hypothetical protein
MSIDYSYMKNGFFMTEKFDFENLSAFNSAEGRIFDPLAVESGDFQQLRSRFFTGYALWKACNGQNVTIFAQI